MQTCPVCEGLLDEALFSNGDNVCRICRARLKQDEDVDFSETGKKTIRQAYTDLLLAIRRQAELDDALEEWEQFWVKAEPWPRIWELLKTTVDQAQHVRNTLRSQIGGRR